MNELFTAISTGVIAFTATNLDDILILLLFFSQINPSCRPQDIVIGQYLGFTILIFLSLPGFFGGLILPPQWIGLLGLLPISMGMNSLVNREEDGTEEISFTAVTDEASTIDSFLSPAVYSVAAITVANGSDNISVYIPLFASMNIVSLFIILGLFFLLLGLWCYAAYKLTHQKTIADFLTRYGNNIVPFVLMGLGAFIVLKSEALSLTKLVASCLCLMILVKNSEEVRDEGKEV